MTFSTNRNDIESMLRRIAMPMMILFCLCGTVMALQGIWTAKFTRFYSVIYSVYCFTAFRMNFMVIFIATILVDLSFLTFPVTFTASPLFLCLVITKISPLMNSFAFFCFTIFFAFLQEADSAIIPISIVAVCTFVKFRDWFCFFAGSASFKYDGFRHFCFSYKQRCSEPATSHALAAGSLIICLSEKH